MKKIGLLFLVMVLALGTLGVAYAMWSDTVTVQTNIATGSVDIAIVGQAVLDDHAPPPYYPTDDPDYSSNDGFVPRFVGDPPVAEYFWTIDKDVSWGSCNYTSNIMTVHLWNTYPSNFNAVTAYVSNLGTIPVIITKTEVYLNSYTPGDTPYATITSSGTYVSLDYDGDGNDEIEISYGDNFGAENQLEPGETPAEISYWIHTLQEAEQATDYTFIFVIYGVQYNEAL
jgi:hypothetical protein